MGQREYSDGQLADIIALRDEGRTYAEVAELYNKRYGTDKSQESMRHAVRTYGAALDTTDAVTRLRLLKETARVRRSNAFTARQNRELLDVMNLKDDLVDRIKELFQTVKIPEAPRATPPARDAAKRNMTLELLVSDVHVGKKSETFTHKVCISRCRQMVAAVKGEVERYGAIYNIDRIIVAMLGDMIENFEMHGIESARGCEFGNSEQVQKCIEVMFYEVLVPLAQLGLPLTVVGIAGNHDRTDEQRSFHDIGKTYLTYIIYNTLEMLVKEAKMENIVFHIPVGPYHVEKIYNNQCLYEHGDMSKAKTELALEALMAKRQTQVGKVLNFMRVGHYHSFACFGRGRIIVNDSMPGTDSYSDANGFDSQAGQTLSFYIDTKNRPTCFYKAFPIYLK